MKTEYTSIKIMISLSAALMLIVTLSTGAGAQQADTSRDDYESVYSGELAWVMGGEQDQPPEIRIMSRIIQTALAGVEAPELPEELTEQGELSEVSFVTTYRRTRDVIDIAPGLPLTYSISRGKVSGFYMSGYGYLFTIHWPIRTSNLFTTFNRGGGGNLVIQLQAQNKALEQLLIQRADRTRSRTTGAGAVAEQTEEEVAAEREEGVRKAEELAEQIERWRSELEDSLINTLKDVMATYGHTLHQAAPGESITFIFEQNDSDEDNITLTIEQSALGGPSEKDRALDAIKVSRGSENVNPVLKDQINIMAEIIDAAFEVEEEGQFSVYISAGGVYFGGEARTQHIPGYGVIFRKNARMNPFILAPSGIPDVPAPAAGAETRVEERMQVRMSRVATLFEEQNEESAEKMVQHLEMLKSKTAEILATYGTTLTELDDSEWVGINFEVGSAAGLLQSGVREYLVLVQMHRVRESAGQGADAADWLLDYIVTNEKQ